MARSLWREPTDEEMKGALEKLTELIGKKLAAAPGWLRRLVIIKNSGSVGVVVNHVKQPLQFPNAPWGDPDDTFPVPIAMPLAEGVALLASASNPEIELARRVRLVDEWKAGQEVKRKANAERQAAEAAENRRIAKERADFRATEWPALNPLQRFGARLALMVQGRDKDLAADIRAVLAIETADPKGASFPHGPWWEGIAVDAGEKAA
ncbi:MAG: hypothetical protein WCG85_23070 [Polyangia bacterium]